MSFRVEYLADYPHFFKDCAAWSYGRWGVQDKNASLDRALSRFQNGSQKNDLPLTVIAINDKTDLPVAMGSLWSSEDTEKWDDLTPWIASVFTLYRYRNMGIASQIVDRLEQDAKRLGYEDIYLQSGSAADFYIGHGYSAIETIQTDQTAAGQQTLLKKALQ
ncbi:MAG: GNAT family N-acetyltransferase [Alphaproteobacteria bacterium]